MGHTMNAVLKVLEDGNKRTKMEIIKLSGYNNNAVRQSLNRLDRGNYIDTELILNNKHGEKLYFLRKE